MLTHRSVASAFLVICCAACSSTSAPVAGCTAARSTAVELDVRDSVSGAGLADSATGAVTALSYQDSLHHVGNDSILWGGDQLGSYTVIVHHPAYADWTKAGVRVSRTGECGNVIPVELTALLVRTP